MAAQRGHQVCGSSAVSPLSLYGYYPDRYLMIHRLNIRDEGRVESLT